MLVLLHQPLVHSLQKLAALERHRRTPEKHEPVERRRTGEQDPLPDVAPLGGPEPGREHREDGDETDRRREELRRSAVKISGRIELASERDSSAAPRSPAAEESEFAGSEAVGGAGEEEIPVSK